MKIDFSSVKTGFELLPEGKVKAIFTGSEVKPTNAGDSFNFIPTFKVTQEGLEGRVKKTWLNMKPESLWNLKGFFIALGMSEENVDAYDGDEAGLVGFAAPFVGNTVVLQIKHGFYNGNPVDNIDRILADVDTETLWSN